MNCDTAQDLMLDHVEGQLDAAQSAELDVHISSCAECRLAMQQTRDLLGAMHDIKSNQERASQASETLRSQGIVADWAAWHSGQRLGDFEVLGEIGRGGMGVVYRARQVSLNRLVALKVLPGIFRQDPTAVTRFQKEAQAAAKLHHTNIVPVYAQGEFEGHFYYAMELVEGESLDRILKRDPSRIVQNLSTRGSAEAAPKAHDDTVPALPPLNKGRVGVGLHAAIGHRAGYRFVARLVAGIADGLDHAHKQGVIHRDIKPQNLLMAADGQLHITDFGLARLLDEPSITLTGEMVGTPAYMSPEQVTGDRRAIDHRTDIYSLGVTFYEVLTGVRPFEGAARDQVVSRILTREPKSPRKINSHVPLDLETICLRAMEKEPGRRYSSAGEMAADLRRFADDRPIFSRRATIVERSIKWVRRHPALTAIYALSIALIAGATAWRVETIHARHARANELVRQAYEMLAIEDYREPAPALAKLAEAEKLGPDDWNYRRAMAFANMGTDTQKAIEMLKGAVAQRPNDSETMYLLAWAMRLQANRVDAGVKAILDSAQSLGGPQTAEAHFFRGQVLVREMDQAEEEYRKARNLNPGYTQALLHLGRALNHWMYHHRKHDKYDDQKKCLEAVCTVQPNRAYPRYLLSLARRLAAEIYVDAGHPEEAQEDLEAALAAARDAQRVEPTNSRGYVAEAEYWELQRDYVKAIELRNRSEPFCKKPEPRTELFQYRWRLYYWVGDYEKALQDLARLVQERDDSDAMRVWYTGLFPALIAAEQGKIEEAVRLARQMAEIHPKSFRAVTSAACMLRILGRGSDADSLLSDHAAQITLKPSGAAEVSSEFMRAAYEFCRHHGSRETVAAAAADYQSDRLAHSVSSFLEAGDALQQGDRVNALQLFRRCDLAYDSEDYCYMARVFVRRLEREPNWPHWIPIGGPQ